MAVRFQFHLRSMFVATTVLALFLSGVIFLWNSLGDAHPAAVRNAYLNGRRTLEEAREAVGDEAKSWPGIKAHIDQRKLGRRASN